MVVTDDFDQEGALKLAKDLYETYLIVVSPRKRRNLAKTVGADFYKPIHESLLRECQLPAMAIDHEGVEAHRPTSWSAGPGNGEAAPQDGLLPGSRSSQGV